MEGPLFRRPVEMALTKVKHFSEAGSITADYHGVWEHWREREILSLKSWLQGRLQDFGERGIWVYVNF